MFSFINLTSLTADKMDLSLNHCKVVMISAIFSPQRKTTPHFQPKDCNSRSKIKQKSRNKASVKEHPVSLLPVRGCS